MLIIAKGKIFFQHRVLFATVNNFHFSILNFFLSSELGFKMHISIKHQVGSLEGKFSYKFSFKSYTVIDYICGGEKKSSTIAPRLNEEPVYFMLLKPKMNKIILNVLIHQ